MVLFVQRARQANTAPRRSFRGASRPRTRVSWILGVAALAVGCSGKKPAASEQGDGPAPKVASPAAPAKPEKVAPQPQEVPDLPAAPEDNQANAGEREDPDSVPDDELQDAGQQSAKDKVDSGLSATAMLAKVSSLKTSDKAAMRYLQQAKDAGSTPKARALAANSRGEKLFSSPERAETFFAWAQDHYPKHPLPPYNRAKLAAIRGEIAKVKEHLKTVKARNGRRLLGKVGFDPTFALVHDDPEVRSLLRGAR